MKSVVNKNGRDFIISETTVPIWVDNQPDYIDDIKKLANHKGNVSSIVFYEDEVGEYGPTGNAKRCYISSDEVKELYKAILDIEEKRTVEQYYTSYL